MTTFEHAMLGINGALACGLERRHGWQVVAMAGVVAVSPDWDALSLLSGAASFDRVHRIWGHNLLVGILLSVTVGALDYRFDFMTRLSHLVGRLPGVPATAPVPRVRWTRTAAGYGFWIAVAVAAGLSHLAADLVVSGTATLADWELQLLWPFSPRGWIFPLVRWGDPGITIVFVAGMFALIRHPNRLRMISRITLLAVGGYLTLRGRFFLLDCLGIIQ